MGRGRANQCPFPSGVCMAGLKPVEEFDLLIFGGAGDLSLRKLLPALFHRDGAGQLPPGSRIFAIGRNAMARDDFQSLVKGTFEARFPTLPEDQWRSFSTRLHYLNLDAENSSTWGDLKTALEGHDDRLRAIYLATPPHLFGPIAKGFYEQQLLSNNMRIVLEKPVGHDEASAREINDEVGTYFPENQIYRIDHYLGKETVQNLLALRFGNALFEPLWRREVIDHVQITVAEDLGVGNRVGYYDGIGALRDMVQNHLLQLLCLVAMEPPSSLDDDAVRDEKLKVLRALKPMSEADVRAHSVRAQYASGAVGGTVVPGFLEELGKASTTETFVALKVGIENWRWSGIPFYLRTGKRMARKHSEIVIQFKPVPHAIFDGAHYDTLPNQLLIQLQPNEGMKLTIMAKRPGSEGFSLLPVDLDLSFEKAFGAAYPDAYERLLIEALRGNPALFMRRDEIETAWRWTDQLISAWEGSRQKVDSYVAGSWGPTSASLLLDRDGRSWRAGS
jgi:glucose-6-phosphate 1-dehydrogenase